MSAAGDSRSPLIATGSPAAYSISTYSGSSGACLRRDRQPEHIVVRLAPGILQDAALVADVHQVAVHRIGLLGGDRHRNLVLRGIRHHVGAPLERPIRMAPGSDHLQLRRQPREGQLEAHLVVAFAGGAVGDRVGAFLACDFDLPLARSPAARSKCRAGSSPRKRRWRAASGTRSRARTPRAGPRDKACSRRSPSALVFKARRFPRPGRHRRRYATTSQP